MNKPITVAEVGINHNGNLDLAKELIKIAKDAGCDYVKFQKRDIDSCYSKEELDKPRESPWGTTTRQQKEGLEFNKAQYDELWAYCKEIGIQMFWSPWDVKSVEFIKQYNPEYIKIPSALITNMTLLKKVKETKIPVIIATGMSSEKEIVDCVEYLAGQIKYVLSCVSTYPTKDSEMNMARLEELLGQRGVEGCLLNTYDIGVGFSNHSPGIVYCQFAIAMGAEMIEFHITKDRSMYGSDQASSIEPSGVDRIGSAVQAWVDGYGTAEFKCLPSEEPIKAKLRR